MKTRIVKGLTTLVLVVATVLTSCEKKDYDDGFTTLGEVYFDANNVAINNTGEGKFLQARTKSGNPVEWRVDGRITAPEGERTFVFYDERTGEVLFEKTVNIISGSPERYSLFQPSEEDPIAVLDPNGQADEAAAPDGFIKLKIANYASDLLSDNLDIVVLGLNMNLETIELATLENVSNNLGEEEYRQVPMGGSDILAYTFKFRDRNTQAFVKNHGGDDYWNQDLFLYPDMISPFPEKRVYTIYFKSSEQWGENPAFIKSGDKFYGINPEILYAD